MCIRDRYLIGQFASETGKKAGEFYTPQAVSKILTKIAIAGQEDKKGLSVYDPCMGSGSLLLNAKKYAAHPGYIKYYGQELNTSTYNLARMNMFLHGIVAENQKLRNGDTLDGDWPTDEETDFNMVLMNPPYSCLLYTSIISERPSLHCWHLLDRAVMPRERRSHIRSSTCPDLWYLSGL